MSINLHAIRRMANPDLSDDIFDAPSSDDADDWRAYVPADIRSAWSEMNSHERIGVLLMAQHLASIESLHA